jgi:hypothetical protein
MMGKCGNDGKGIIVQNREKGRFFVYFHVFGGKTVKNSCNKKLAYLEALYIITLTDYSK